MSVLTSVSGFPRIGQNRELKKIIEAYWKGVATLDDVRATAKELRAKHWKLQQEAGVEFTVEEAFNHIMEYAHWSTNAAAVKAAVAISGETVDQFTDDFGVPTGLRPDNYGAGHASVRANFQSDPKDSKTQAKGEDRMKPLQEFVESKGGEFLFNTAGKRLIMEDGACTGVQCEGDGVTDVKAKAVIVATGGFADDDRRMTKWGFDLTTLERIGTPGHFGDGINMMYMDTKDGHMLTDLVEIGGKKYYFASNGLMQRGMIPLNGKIYLFGADGAMQYGFYSDQTAGTRYFKTDGSMAANELLTVGTNKYYFNTNGVMATGLTNIGGVTYLFGADGAMQYGWYTDASGMRYFQTNGAMAVNTTLAVGGVTYVFDANGLATAVPVINPATWVTDPATGVTIDTATGAVVPAETVAAAAAAAIAQK